MQQCSGLQVYGANMYLFFCGCCKQNACLLYCWLKNVLLAVIALAC